MAPEEAKRAFRQLVPKLQTGSLRAGFGPHKGFVWPAMV